MVKVLVANSNKTKTKNCCEYLSNDKDLKVFGTNTGMSTLDTYLEIKPDIFILDTQFDDVSGIEIIDKLSLFLDEKKKCNTIVTTKNIREQSLIQNTSKIYKIVRNPSNKDLLTTVNQMCLENKYPELDMADLEEYLVDLGFHLKSNGTDYMESAIQLCYYFPKYQSSLDSILEYIAKEYCTSPLSVGDAMRASLKPLNNYLAVYEYEPNSIYNLFNRHIDVTPKTFIEKSATYFRKKMKKRNK